MTADAENAGDAVAAGRTRAADATKGAGEAATGGSWGAKAEPAGDARLRAAVAAWVRTGDPAPTSDPRAEAAAAETAERPDNAVKPDAGAEPQDRVTDAVEPDSGPEPEDRVADAVPESADPEDRVADAAKPGTGPEPEGRVTDAVKRGADAEPEDRVTDAGPESTDPEDGVAESAQPEDRVADAAKPGAGPVPADRVTDAVRPGADAEPEDRVADAVPEPADKTADVEDATPDHTTATAPAADKPAAPAATPAQPAAKRTAKPPTDTPTLTPRVTPAPQAADGEDAPQGPPAGDDESRAGGAGGSDDKRDGAAEAPVDQPTTMLKLPPTQSPAQSPTQGPAQSPAQGAAQSPAQSPAQRPRPVEQPAERTSKFVALKPDMTASVPQVGPERTTQQPLPPKPPLDLLAELTNTPPPPETPLRTTVRRVKIWTPLVLLVLVVFAIVQSVRPLPAPTLELTAKDSYSFDGGKVDIPWPADGQAALDVQGIGSFGSSGEQKSVPIASVAKVMTAYLVLRDHPLKSGAAGPKIKVDQAAQQQGENAGQESTVKVTAGDSITQREALESILIASANNVARLLARWDAGSEKAFVEKMNAAAEDLGMTNTTYTDPSGLNNTTVSTAVDQVKLAKKAMEYPAFREVAAMMSYDDYKGENHSNWNQLVGKNNVVGIKTGTTTSALGNLVFAAKKDVNGETRTIVGAVIRQPAGGVENTILSAALTAGDQLIRAAQDALKSSTIIKKGEVVGYVDDGLGGRTPVIATKDVTAVGWSGLTVKLTFAGDDVPHSAEAGTKVGTLTVGDASAGAVKVPVALQEDLVEPGFAAKLTRIT
ncbi:serine hydrolase [Streptomyces sp. NPDC020489]|uniref:serine hydrolase n=1 Tax=Streptomyces sp. NPDC020489 TaxID=3365077 RepID=UPI0037AB23DA